MNIKIYYYTNLVRRVKFWWRLVQKRQSLREQNMNICRDSGAIWRSSFIWHAGGLEYRTFDLSLLMGNYLCTSRENLVIFGLVMPEFEAKDVVRPESYVRCAKFVFWEFGGPRSSAEGARIEARLAPRKDVPENFWLFNVKMACFGYTWGILKYWF